MFEEDFVDLSGLVTINIGEMKAAFLTRGDMSQNFVTIDDKKIAQPFLNILSHIFRVRLIFLKCCRENLSFRNLKLGE